MTTIPYPNYAPKHMPSELLGRKAKVHGSDGEYYLVDFNMFDCDCPQGAAWHWSGTRYVESYTCRHKLRALSSAYEELGSPAVRDFYDRCIGKAYNPFVAISAFHKELRRGNIEGALYWCEVLKAHRGRRLVLKYMANIVYEETRDISLDEYIVSLMRKGDGLTQLDLQRCVRRFAAAPKKWELPWRLEIFLDEMRAYKKLAEQYGYEVAKPSNIIPASQTALMRRRVLRGYKTGDRVLVQRGVKGWMKLRTSAYDALKVELLNILVDVLNGEFPNAFSTDPSYASRVYDAIYNRLSLAGAIGYHDINALADALTGERPSRVATLPITQHKRHTLNPALYRLPLGTYRRTPLYANDNHTWAGKALMRTYHQQLRPGAIQENLDFRLCGAYMGVAWRTLAYSQGLTLECKWGDVKFNTPMWLWEHLNKMWY